MMALVNPETAFCVVNRQLVDEGLREALTHAKAMTEVLKDVELKANYDGDLPLVAKLKTWRGLLREIARGVGPEETSADNGLIHYVRRAHRRQGWPDAD